MKVLKRRTVLKRKEVLKNHSNTEQEETKKPRKSNVGNTLPSDEYKDEIPPREVILNEDGKLVISVKRGGADGLPRADIRYFATTDVYTGFTKKGVNFDLENLPDLIAVLEEVVEQCDKKKLFDEFE